VASGNPIQGKTITFTIGTQSTTGTTNSSGIATATLILDQVAGTSYTVTASFAGDSAFQAGSDSKSFTIRKETASAIYTGDTIAMTTSTYINLRATVEEESDSNPGDTSKAVVIFQVCPDGSSPCSSIPAGVSSTGVATGQYPTGGKENTYLVTITFDVANKYYTGDESVPASVTVYAPTGAFATGGGWIWDTKSGGHGNFGFVVRSTSSKVQGHSGVCLSSQRRRW